MTPSLSLRSALAYAGNLLSQFPISLDLPNPIASIVNPVLDNFVSSTFKSSDIRTYEPLSGTPSCPVDGPTSCRNNTPVAGDSCCFVYPGGRMLLTQFWDREVHAGGAEEDWTLHGLWPDLCDGSYDAYCNMAPRFNNITEILLHYDQSELIDHMNRYWVADRGSNSHLWAHEYNKHATCINTLSPTCYGDYSAGQEVVDYFVRAFSLFKLLDTFTALELASIVPDERRWYPLEDVRKILEQFSGGRVVLRCGGRGRNELHEAWYVYFVQGSLQSGEFVPAQDYGLHGDANNCPSWVKYLPKRHKR